MSDKCSPDAHAWHIIYSATWNTSNIRLPSAANPKLAVGVLSEFSSVSRVVSCRVWRSSVVVAAAAAQQRALVTQVSYQTYAFHFAAHYRGF